jgi:hypothetical protein
VAGEGSWERGWAYRTVAGADFEYAIDPVYVAFDLRESLRMPVPSPSEDVAIVRRIFAVARALPPIDHVADLERALGKELRSNRNERRALLETLGIADVL